MAERIGFRGHIEIIAPASREIDRGTNKIMNAGLAAIVDALQASANLSGFKYIGYGTVGNTTTGAEAGLSAELSGGGYTRCLATQGEGPSPLDYKLSAMDWINATGSTKVIREVAIFNQTSGGTPLARSCTTDNGWTEKSIDNGQNLTINSWTVSLSAV